MLRSFTKADAVWRQALLHKPPYIPKLITFQLADLSGPGHINDANTPTTDHPTSSVSTHVEKWGNNLPRRSASTLRGKYLDARRARKLLCGEVLCIETTNVILDGCPRCDIYGMGFTLAGEIFWISFDKELQLFDLRDTQVNKITIKFAPVTVPPKQDLKRNWYLAEVARWRGEEGVMLVSDSCIEKELDVFFQPLPRPTQSQPQDSGNGIQRPILMYKIALPSMPQRVTISGHYLIVSMQGALKIIDLISPRETFSLHETVRVYGSQWCIFSSNENLAFAFSHSPSFTKSSMASICSFQAIRVTGRQ
ncbi:hypothetical protein DL93DRAFT_727469 [Clavulina sp. PMI_390]|nr:hypothetical protein DL93DRAFT_727469 [Clavulina sp. PMI_390]